MVRGYAKDNVCASRRPASTIPLFALLASLALSTCGDGSRANETRHPLPANMPDQGGELIVDASATSALLPAEQMRLRAIHRRLLDAPVVFSLGRDDGGPETFASIVDADVDSGGNLYVLDEQLQEILMFGSSLFYMGSRNSSFGIASDPRSARRSRSTWAGIGRRQGGPTKDSASAGLGSPTQR